MDLRRLLLSLILLINLSSEFIIAEVYADEQRFNLKYDSNRLFFEIDIPENHFIYSHQQQKTGLPTDIKLHTAVNLKDHKLTWPLPKYKILEFGDEVFFYENHLEIPLTVYPINSFKDITAEFDIEYVLCSNQCQLIHEQVSLVVQNNWLNTASFTKVDTKEFCESRLCSRINIRSAGSLLNSFCLNLSEFSCTILRLVNFEELILFNKLFCLAILGGFILNFMPCVLPVLSLKLISFVRHNDSIINRKRALLCTIIGIMSSFWIMAFVAIWCKRAGKHFGLGINFQEPSFIIALILIITFFISISLEQVNFRLPHFISILMEPKSSLNHWLRKIRLKNLAIYIEHYSSGILATILSTPCTAPFLGSVLFLSLQASNKMMFLIFSFIGLGFSLPYIGLLIWPKLLQLLPKSGKWLIRLKLFLVFLLVCTIFWLLNILNAQIGTRGTVGLFLLILLIKFILGNNQFIFKYFIAKLLILFILIYCSFVLPMYSYVEDNAQQEKVDNLWQKFEPKKILPLVKSGKIVFIDITADWCVTCKYNKYFVLDTNKVIKLLSNPKIVAMRGDFTNHNLEIHQFLIQRKVNGIPYNVIFSSNFPQGIELPIILSVQDVEKLISGNQ